MILINRHNSAKSNSIKFSIEMPGCFKSLLQLQYIRLLSGQLRDLDSVCLKEAYTFNRGSHNGNLLTQVNIGGKRYACIRYGRCPLIKIVCLIEFNREVDAQVKIGTRGTCHALKRGVRLTGVSLQGFDCLI